MLDGSTNILKNIYRYGLEPSMMYFSEDLTKVQVEEFIKRISLNENGTNRQDFQTLQEISKILAGTKPSICLLVSDKFSNSDIPGFITIPYNFRLEKLIKYIENNIEKASESRTKYDELMGRVEDLKDKLRTKADFQKIELAEEKLKSSSQLESAILSLKRLLRFFSKPVIDFDLKQKLRYYNLCIGTESLGLKQQTICVPMNYDDNLLENVLKQLN